MYTGKGKEIWGAKDGKWISENEIEYVKEILNHDGKIKENIVKMRFVNDTWIEK
ncbi:MAG: hypothetical protein GY756_02455 [bacterium]|nr:hypothetical protein [bacterium]